MKIFLDTNVWIDFLLERKPFYASAASVISFAELRSDRICISSLTAVNAHYICCERMQMPVGTVTAKMKALDDLLEICSVTGDDVRRAYAECWPDMEDGVQHSAALRAGVGCMVTRNKRDFSLASLTVLTPEEFLAGER